MSMALAALAEHPLQSQIVRARPVHCIASRLAPVVLAERARILADRLDILAVRHSRPLAANLLHQPIDVLEFLERGPALILASPARLRLHPYGEGFGEILGRMTLRVPMAEMQHVV